VEASTWSALRITTSTTTAPGLLDTISYLDSVGVRHVGAGRNIVEAHRPVIDTLRGVKSHSSRTMEGVKHREPGIFPGVARRDLAEVCRDIRSLKDGASSRYIVVMLHWGPKGRHPRTGPRLLSPTLSSTRELMLSWGIILMSSRDRALRPGSDRVLAGQFCVRWERPGYVRHRNI